jgi:GDP-L-fucose synthase
MLTKDILDSFSGKKALVTGGTGMIGRQVVDILCGAGASVRIVSLDNLNVHPKAEHILGNLIDFEFCKSVIKGVDYVFHLAGVKGSASVSNSMIASHFVPTLMFNTNVLEACRLSSVEKVVYTSSIGAYANAEVFKEGVLGVFNGPPMDFAGWAKRMAELQIQAYKVQYGLNNFAVVRPCNVYGIGDSFSPSGSMVIPSLIYRIYNGESPLVVWGDGAAIRDFAYSKDVARGIILALYHGTGGRYVNLGSGKGYSIKELVETLHSFIDFDYEFDVDKPSGFPKRVMDISLAREMIGYNPTTTLLEGLKETWEWYIKNHDEYLKKQDYFKE